MAGGMPWTPEEDELLRRRYGNGEDAGAIAADLGRSRQSVISRAHVLGVKFAQDRLAQDQPITPEQAAYPKPDERQYLERIGELEAENARLREQLVWAQFGGEHSEQRTGGTLTIRRSDEHIADKNHLLHSLRQCEEKTLVLVEQYKPERIQIIWGDDLICGRGIYKEQDLDSATSSPTEQCQVGAVRMRRYLQSIRKVSQAPIMSLVIRGNHNYAGTTDLTPLMFLTAKEFCSDVEDVRWMQGHDRALVNLAHEGTYNALVTHGFGHSNQSPNSGAFVDAMKDVIITIGRKLQPSEHIRRVISGHTHYLSVGLERICDLYFDTTGGFQRNTRVKLGMNQRPVGFIAYVSLPGMDGEILRPIEIKPNPETLEREMNSPTLTAENQMDAGQCIAEAKELSARFTQPEGLDGIVMAGRW